MKKLTLILMSIVTVCSMFVSCISSDGSNTTTLSGYFTIEGTYPNYVLYMDGGGIVYCDPQSVASLTEGKGFGNVKRASISATCDFDKMTKDAKGQVIIKDARLTYCSAIPERKVLSTDIAEQNNILASDSLFDFLKYNECWYYRNYLTLIVTGFYSLNDSQRGIMPTVNLVCADDSISANRIAFNICYNQHAKKDDKASVNYTYFTTSYNIVDYLKNTPGNDTVSVVLHGTINKKQQSVTIKCPRPSYSEYYN